MSRDRYKFYESSTPYFVTCTAVGWLPIFTHPPLVQFVLDSWQFLHDHKRMTLLGYVVLENHLHFIATSPNLGKEVGDFKSFTARQIIDWLQAHHHHSLLQQLEFYCARHKTDRTHQLWQEGSHPKQIKDDEMMW